MFLNHAIFYVLSRRHLKSRFIIVFEVSSNPIYYFVINTVIFQIALFIHDYSIYSLIFPASHVPLVSKLQVTTLRQSQVQFLIRLLSSPLRTALSVCIQMREWSSAVYVTRSLGTERGCDVTRYTPQTTRDRRRSNMGRCSHCFHV